MKIRDVFDYVDELYENVFSEKNKLRWLNQLEAELQTEVLLLAAEGITQYTKEDMDAELIAPAPFDKIYEEYLIWRMMTAQGEAERANNQQVILDEAWKAYARFVAETVDPKSGLAQTIRYYLSAYQVAVKHGYAGTEVEWVASLKGDKGETGAGLNIRGQAETEEQLPDLDVADEGTAYLVGSGFGALLYIWDGNAWFYKQPISVKGEDFTYEDFTPEQLEELRGPRGYQGEPVNVERVLEDPNDGGVNTVFFTDGKQLQVRNGTKGVKGDPGYTPQKGTDYTDGEDGGYYAMQISQPSSDTVRISYTPSKTGMPSVSTETLQLPKGPKGEGVYVSGTSESEDDGGRNVIFFSDGTEMGVRNGRKGKSGVEISDTEPADPEVDVWIKPNGESEIRIPTVLPNPHVLRFTGAVSASYDGTSEVVIKIPEGGNSGSGEPGKDGITPHIGANGNWYLGETDTGVKAQGEDGVGITDIQKRTVAGVDVMYIILSDGTEKGIPLPVPENGNDYVLTDADKQEIAALTAPLVEVPEGGGGIDVSGATVGQTVKIASVDGNGVPTAWEATDFPESSGGGEGSWELVTDITLEEDVQNFEFTGLNAKGLQFAWNGRFNDAEDGMTNANQNVYIKTSAVNYIPVASVAMFGYVRPANNSFWATGELRIVAGLVECFTKVVSNGNNAVNPAYGGRPHLQEKFDYFKIETDKSTTLFKSGGRFVLYKKV